MSSRKGTRSKVNHRQERPVKPAVFAAATDYHLLVVRESDASDLLLFEEMARRTIALVIKDAPELVDLSGDPMAPIHDPSSWDAIVERRKSHRSVRFLLGHFIVMYHLGSAAKIEEESEVNFFTETLLDTIATYDVRRVTAFGVNRLVREVSNGHKLAEVFSRSQALVTTSATTFDFSLPTSSIIWDIMCTIADQERTGIVERTRLGRIAVSRRNEWPHGADVIPLGYMPINRTIAPDPTEKGRVHRLLSLMADPTLSMRQFTEALGPLQIVRPRLSNDGDQERMASDVRHPRDLFASFMSFLSLYETGIYEMHLPNPTRGADVFGGLPVYRDDDDPDDLGTVTLPFDFGLPEGGWAEPEVFEGIRAKIAENRVFATSSRARRPFGGRPVYEVGGKCFKIDSNSSSRYRLRECVFEDAVPGASVGTKTGDWRSLRESKTVATINASALHQAVIEGIIDALGSIGGVPGHERPIRFRVVEDPEVALERTLTFHRNRAALAREQALRSENLATADAFRLDAEREESEVARLLNGVASSGAPEEVEISDVHIDAELVLRTLAKVGRAEASVPNDVVVACRHLIPDLRLWPTGAHHRVAWSAMVHLPTVEGDVLELGPIQGEVASNVVSVSAGEKSHRDDRMLASYANGVAMAKIGEDNAMLPSSAWISVRSQLAEGGIPANILSRLANCPIPEIQMLLGGLVVGGKVEQVMAQLGDREAIGRLLSSGSIIPDHVDEAWAVDVVERYLSPVSRSLNWTSPNDLAQDAVDLAVSGAGTVTVRELQIKLGARSPSMAALINDLTGFGRVTMPSVLRTLSTPQRDGRLKYPPDLELIPHTCPHCQKPLTVVLRVLEVPQGLLCEACRRTPTAEHVFPESYFAVPRGVRWVASKLRGSEATPKPRKRSSSPEEMSDDLKAQVVAEYQDPARRVAGPGGILDRYRINSTRLYRIVDAAGVDRRRPYRPRQAQGNA